MATIWSENWEVAITKLKIAFIIILIFLFPKISLGAVTLPWTEDFEAWSWDNYDDPDSQDVNIVTDRSVSPTHSFRGDLNQGSQGFTAIWTPVASSTWVWLTFQMWMDSGWYVTSGFHFPCMNYGIDIVQFDFRTSYSNWNEGQTGLCINTSTDHPSGMDTAQPVENFWDRWTKLQLGVQYSTKSVEVWKDNVRIFNHTMSELNSASQMQKVIVRIFNITGTPPNGYIYLDDVSVDTGDRPGEGSVSVPKLTGIKIVGGSIR